MTSRSDTRPSLYHPQRTANPIAPTIAIAMTIIQAVLAMKYGYTIIATPVTSCGQRVDFLPYKKKPKPTVLIKKDAMSAPAEKFMATACIDACNLHTGIS